MDRELNKDKWSSLVWLGVAGFICLGAYRLSLGSFSSPGPGFLPFIAGIFLAVLSCLLFTQSRRSSIRPRAANNIWSKGGKGPKVILTIFILFSYALGMEYLGFLLSTILFLALLLRTIEPQRWIVVLFTSLSASSAAYLIFERWLQCQLPKGVLKFF